MTSTLARAAAAIAFVIATVFPVSAAGDKAPQLMQLVEAWFKISDFSATISGHELDGNSIESRTFRYAYLRPNHAKLEMLDGPSRGMTVVWNGGDRVTAYHRGFLAPIRLTFGLHDRTVTSLRGNTLGTPDLSPTLHCFESKLDNVQQTDGPFINGATTTILTLEDKNGLHCNGDVPKDFASITKDIIFLSRETNLPVRRERYAGDTQVEVWDLVNLRINTGLSSKDFS